VGGARGGINAPTVYNAGYQFLQFWDGREPTLEAQAKGPVANPIEMAAEWPVVVEKLRKDTALAAEFAAAGYTDGITQDTVVSAIAEFERTLITPNSRFDKHLMGQAGALSADEMQGYELFKEYQCANCHVGKILGGQSFELMGRAKDYFTARGDIEESDLGRFNVTKQEKDRHRFKVPTLRNIAVTYPYLHEGSTNDLAKVVEIMAEYQSATSLSAEKTAQIVGFLKTLTGEYQGKLLQ
jgi:cytochrome c peroxidase